MKDYGRLFHSDSIDARDTWGETRLMLAAQQGDLDEVKQLIEAGADVSLEDNLHCTARVHAIMKGHDHVVAYFDGKEPDEESAAAELPGDEELYLRASRELTEKRADTAFLTKAITLAEGDKQKARHLYVKLRVKSLKSGTSIERDRSEPRSRVS